MTSKQGDRQAMKKEQLKELIENTIETEIDINKLLKDQEINLKRVCIDACYFGVDANRIEYLVLCDKDMREVKAIKSEDLKKYAK